MKNLSLSILLLFFIGCISQKKCNERYPPNVFLIDSTYTKDSVFVKHDTIIIGGDLVVIQDTIPCPDYHKEVKNNRLTASVIIKSGKITVKCKEDSLQEIIEEQDHFIREYRLKDKSSTIQPPPCEHNATKTDIFCYWITSILILYAAGKIYFTFIHPFPK